MTESTTPPTKAYAGIVDEGVADPDGIAAPADAGDHDIREASRLLEDLPSRF